MTKGAAKAAKRVPSSAVQLPSPQRIPMKLRGVSVESPHSDHHPLWRLQLLDQEYDGDWSWQKIDGPTTLKIVNLLTAMERLTWLQVRSLMTGGRDRRGALHKSIPVGHLCTPAQQRLSELGLDDLDEMFRFRLGNMERLWGVIVNEGPLVFYPVWWDPDHKICPSQDR